MAAGAVLGLFGTLPFLFGGASSSGGILGRLFTFPVAILESLLARSGAAPEEANSNLIAFTTQFFAYFLLGCIVFVIRSIVAGKHNKPLKTDGGRSRAKRTRVNGGVMPNEDGRCRTHHSSSSGR